MGKISRQLIYKWIGYYNFKIFRSIIAWRGFSHPGPAFVTTTAFLVTQTQLFPKTLNANDGSTTGLFLHRFYFYRVNAHFNLLAPAAHVSLSSLLSRRILDRRVSARSFPSNPYSSIQGLVSIKA